MAVTNSVTGARIDTFPATANRWDSMPELVFLVEEAAEGGFVARALGESIITEADSYEQLRDSIRDAVRCHFAEGTRPVALRLHFVRDEVIAA